MPTAVAATLICRLATLWFAVIIGGIVLAAIIGTLLIGALVVYIRVWWMTRKMRNGPSQRQGQGQGQGQESYVEVEYR